MNTDGTIPLERLVNESNVRANADTELQTAINNIVNNKNLIANENGGVALGYNASVSLAGTGAAVGNNASATAGGAVGNNASATNGGAVGYGAKSEGILGGGAIGYNAYSNGGGGAIGCNATATSGFSGGYNAKSSVDAIQLGTGTNSVAKTLQVYGYQLMDSSGFVPLTRLHSPTLLWNGSATSGTLTLSQDMSNYRYFILEGLQSTSLGNIITAFVFRNGRTSLQIYLGQNGTSNAYEMAVTISGTSATIAKRQNAIIKYIYGIE